MTGGNKRKILNISLPPGLYREVEKLAKEQGKAEYIISEDVHHLQALKEYRGIRILSPAQFLEFMKL